MPRARDSLRQQVADLQHRLREAKQDAAQQRALAEETVRLRDAVWAIQEWWRALRDEQREKDIERILDRVHQCVFCKKSLGPQENKDSQGDGWWRCWPPCEPSAEAHRSPQGRQDDEH